MRSYVSGPDSTNASGFLRRLGGSWRRRSEGGSSKVESAATITATITATLTPEQLYLSPLISASINAIIAALRWGTVMLGLIIAATEIAASLEVVGAVALAIFLTSWRTISPLKLGDVSAYSIGLALADVVIVALAVSLHDGFANPMVGTLYVTIAVVGFGWGLPLGLTAALLAFVTVSIGRIIGGDIEVTTYGLDLLEKILPSAGTVTTLAGMAIVPGVALNRVLEFEGRRVQLVKQRNKLAQTNELLTALNDLARTLPSSLDIADVVQNTRRELIETFDARRIALLSYEDGTWSPVLQDGFGYPPEMPTAALPPELRHALNATVVIRLDDLSLVSNRQGCGLYVRLVIRNTDTGLLAIEHTEPGYYDDRAAELLTGMSNVLALTLANARSFNRLRSLAANEERTRIARDLHDRLGQYLTYIAIELERINRNEPSTELKELHEDVQGAISEFRGTLLELRAAVTAEKPLSMVLEEVVDRFSARSELDVKLVVPDNHGDRLPARVENELLRIAQEALTNIEKHAKASKVHVSWSISVGVGVLVVQDDGRGFDPTQGIRGNAYGLVGMRERATSVGAFLTISSKPDEGTVITVRSSQTAE
jgi:signal transduction histidine kinase